MRSTLTSRHVGHQNLQNHFFFSKALQIQSGKSLSRVGGGGEGGGDIFLPPHAAAVLCRCWSSGSPSCRPQSPPTTPPSQPTIFTGPRSQTRPSRLNQTPLTFMRSPGLSMRVGVSTGDDAAGVAALKMDFQLEGGVVKLYSSLLSSFR